MSKAARWLDLIAFLLQHRFPVTRGQIFQSVAGYGLKGRDPDEIPSGSTEAESARRKFERDKDELRALGLDIETIGLADRAGDEASDGYRLRTQGIYLPYLEFDEGTDVRERPYPALQRIPVTGEEFEILDRATNRLAAHPSPSLSAAARSARRKLGFDLPLTVQQIERVLGESGRDEPNDALEVLQQAVARRTRVTCTYYSIGRDAEEPRTLEPYGLFFSWGHWYCVANDGSGAAPKVFRVDRVSGAKLVKGKHAVHDGPPEGFDASQYVGRSAWELSERAPEPVVVRFGFPDARWVVAQGVGDVREPYTDDGGAVVAFSVREREPFLRWLLTFGDRAVVDEPAALADDLVQLRDRVAALYAADA
jgi:proteasome accessory factor B